MRDDRGGGGGGRRRAARGRARVDARNRAFWVASGRRARTVFAARAWMACMSTSASSGLTGRMPAGARARGATIAVRATCSRKHALTSRRPRRTACVRAVATGAARRGGARPGTAAERTNHRGQREAGACAGQAVLEHGGGLWRWCARVVLVLARGAALAPARGAGPVGEAGDAAPPGSAGLRDGGGRRGRRARGAARGVNSHGVEGEQARRLRGRGHRPPRRPPRASHSNRGRRAAEAPGRGAARALGAPAARKGDPSPLTHGRWRRRCTRLGGRGAPTSARQLPHLPRPNPAGSMWLCGAAPDAVRWTHFELRRDWSVRIGTYPLGRRSARSIREAAGCVGSCEAGNRRQPV